ncbi:MAG: hypothetical protein KDE04_08720 [Anaerolineales bacterium]|nr:hypothetical protein [Anaerolineales bacterium]
MPTFAEHFELDKQQFELDFINITLERDLPLFIDPFALSQRTDRWSQNSHRTLVTYFQQVVDFVRTGNKNSAFELLRFLQEPNETRLGYSSGKPQGAGIGSFQARQLLNALSESSAVTTGFLNSLEETELMIEGISRDKISDLTTNVIRSHLAEYTLEQCKLHGIPTRPAAVAPCYSIERGAWTNDYLNLPVVNNAPVLLVPKVIARFHLAYDHQKYYRSFAVEYLRTEAIEAGSSLVRTLKNGHQIVHKRDIEATFKCTKANLYAFSREHPEVLEKYRRELIRLEAQDAVHPISEEDEHLLAIALAKALVAIPSGSDRATDYHNLMIGVLEFIFFPKLLFPQKEREIHDGRKRIDILMENGARNGIFDYLHAVRNLPCAFVAIECKNYTSDVANPELDQLAGRFSPNRGKLGIMCCRRFENRELFLERCKDTFRDDRGLILCLDDAIILRLLKLIRNNQRHLVEIEINHLVDEIWLG